jgi:hypothetical protein
MFPNPAQRERAEDEAKKNVIRFAHFARPRIMKGICITTTSKLLNLLRPIKNMYGYPMRQSEECA